MIIRTVVAAPFESNCYIVVSEAGGKGMIVDAGAGAKQITKVVEKLGAEIELIVLTHGHLDHVGGLREIKDATGAQLALHVDETETLRTHGLSLGMFGVDFPAPSAPDRLLKDGDIIKVGDLRFQVLHTPGHTPGGISLYGHGAVFTGDTLFNYSIGRSDLPGGDFRQLMNSIRTRLMALPDSTVVYPGHGPESTIGEERRGNPFLTGRF